MKDLPLSGWTSAGVIISMLILLPGPGPVSVAMASDKFEDRSYADIGECKAVVEEIRDEEIASLNKKKQMMGAGMPNSIYSRKRQKIRNEYESNLQSCDSLVTSRVR